MASEPLIAFNNLALKKDLRYISFEEACIFHTSTDEKLILQRAIELVDQDQTWDDEAPPKYSVFDIHCFPSRILDERQDEDLGPYPTDNTANDAVEACGRAYQNGDSLNLSPPWFVTEVPRELRRVTQNAPPGMCAIIQLTYLENSLKRTAALADGKDELEFFALMKHSKDSSIAALEDKLMPRKIANAKAGDQASSVVRAFCNKLSLRYKRNQISADIKCTSSSNPLTHQPSSLPCGHSYGLESLVWRAETATKIKDLRLPGCCQQEAPVSILKQTLTKSQLRKPRAKQEESATHLDERCFFVKPNCRYGFGWLCNSTVSSCMHSHADVVISRQASNRQSPQQRHECEAQLDAGLILRRILSSTSSTKHTMVEAKKLKKLITEIARCPEAIALQKRFQSLRESYQKLHQAQVRQIQQRNQACISLATELRDEAFRKQQRTEEKPRKETKELGDSCRLSGETLNVPCKGRQYGLKKLEMDTFCHEDGKKLQDEKRDIAMEDAERALLQVKTRLLNDEKWAEITSMRCLEKLSMLQQWEWEAMLHIKFPNTLFS